MSTPLCPVHRVRDLRGAHATALPLPRCEGATQFGVWDENDAGFVYAGDCATEAGNWAAEILVEALDAEMRVTALCSEHPEQLADGCEDCYRDDDEPS
ncbi:hypothetical protein OHS33_39240 (plasmid) [Streptomyces sp. NBC_00536]|uniref:hypothetical protein n=1 Tax=Streptomyces sp. NBC_00536 TaxID=2975769 RepID=UPI002E81E708|nr:hypothetical protein [Streptomyces sp. NBC_00536]WUC84395.1 hypothetical protein OHS33_39240 [Streptomyces sp. NBC_00536]